MLASNYRVSAKSEAAIDLVASRCHDDQPGNCPQNILGIFFLIFLCHLPKMGRGGSRSRLRTHHSQFFQDARCCGRRGPAAAAAATTTATTAPPAPAAATTAAKAGWHHHLLQDHFSGQQAHHGYHRAK